MRTGNAIYLFFVLSCVGLLDANAQDTLSLTLKEVVAMAKDKSIASRQAATLRETHYWEYMTYRSNYQPQLSLSGTLPGYTKSFIQVLQPNGTIDFQPVHNNNSSLELAFSQQIAQTGGTISGSTSLQRFDDFDRNTTIYNGAPYGIGYVQPLFQFNTLKWDRRIEPLKYNESRQAYIESMEEIAMNASNYFFDLLLAQVDLQIAATNLKNTQSIMKIASLKFDMGKVTKNEILQLQLEELKVQKAEGIARRDMEVATYNLKAYTGLQNSDKIRLQMPQSSIGMKVIAEKALAEAFQNRSDAIAFGRRLEEAKRDVAKAKGDNGLNASLNSKLGFSKSATRIGQVYQSPKDQQLLELTLEIPILDWGRQKARKKTAMANQQFTQYSVEQDKQNFIQKIITEVNLFDMMKGQLLLTAKAEKIAAEKYQIAKERYVLGNLSITDLSIAFQENDQAKRDHINSLRDFWGAYYELRYLSLYDFETEQKITYNKL
jgi:outer membrane protein